MTVLSSRPVVSATITEQQVLDAARPAINLVHWIASMIRFPDDSPTAVRAAAQTVEDALECLLLPDYAVIPTPGFMGQLHYDVAVKPIEGAQFVAFQVRFDIQP
jgi:hypothetical protein